MVQQKQRCFGEDGGDGLLGLESLECKCTYRYVESSVGRVEARMWRGMRYLRTAWGRSLNLNAKMETNAPTAPGGANGAPRGEELKL